MMAEGISAGRLQKRVCLWLLGGICLLTADCMMAQQGDSPTVYVTQEDRAVFERYRTEAEAWKDLPIEELMIRTARFFLGTPYVASTLEKEPEGLVVNLREMDCTTFAEYVLALSRWVQGNDRSFDAFCKDLKQIRYRNGEIGDYTDRLHYMTDWLYENERKGLVQDVNRELGGEALPLHLSFISTHPGSYKQLKGHPERLGRMAAKEKEINGRTYFYLPEKDLPRLAAGLKNGDLVCFVTTIRGLDVTHVGIICREEEKLTFIHASSTAGKVVVNPESLTAYTRKMKNNRGILIIRPSGLK